MTAASDRLIVRAGGIALIGGAVAFLGVFAYLAARFNYPDVLDGSASDVLPALLATGSSGRAAWAFYSLLPLIWIPASVGAFHALRRSNEPAMRLAVQFATIGAVSMMLGLMRWPSIHWELARVYGAATGEQRGMIDPVFLGLNRYLGNYVGEFVGELTVSLFFLLSAVAMLRTGSGFARWVGFLGIATSVAGLIGMFRNVTNVVSAAADVNNYLLPLWMIVFGVALLRTTLAAIEARRSA